jgi:hypothetical protein
MLINNQLDYRYDAEYLAIPEGLNLDKKAVAAFEKAWLAYDSAQVDYYGAVANFENADAKDTLLLIAAVKAGEEHPGEPTKTEAQRSLDYATEKLRQAAIASNALAEKVRNHVRLNAATLTAEAVALERQAMVGLLETMDEAKRTTDKAIADAAILGQRVNWITAITQPDSRELLVVPTIAVSWPAGHEYKHGYMTAYLDRLEQAPTPEVIPEPPTEESEEIAGYVFR